jgi:hypothetical protein
MLERIDGITNEVLEPITFVLGKPTVYITCLCKEGLSLTTVSKLPLEFNFESGSIGLSKTTKIVFIFCDHWLLMAFHKTPEACGLFSETKFFFYQSELCCVASRWRNFKLSRNNLDSGLLECVPVITDVSHVPVAWIFRGSSYLWIVAFRGPCNHEDFGGFFPSTCG